MAQSRTVHTIDSHTCGHPTRLVVDGIPELPGTTVRDKQEYFAANHDRLRTSLLYEPRGHAGMFAAIVVRPVDPAADIGLMFLSIHKYLSMCGHGTIGAVTSLLESGRLPCRSPVTSLNIETPSGLVPVEARTRDGRVTDVSFTNVPSYVRQPRLSVELDGIGAVPVDLGYGGEWYAMVDVARLGTSFSADNLPELLRLGARIKRSLKDSGGGLPLVSGALLYDLSSPQGTSRGIVVFSDTRYDRSPCGTGTSALTALLVERGVLGKGDTLLNSSIIGTTFEASVEDVIEHDGERKTVPRVRGSAHITGFNQLVIADDDPLSEGFLLNVD
ncbi:proline racemase family protein [Amycolatopsis sp. K13G38]|uniref:Proline racemase family protein n=1 Tax=Amycolatopsis acididurans TaxID=2724524 RepID=A0ABX1JD35_9PSEU|nr:proline racemase family protein [Amycolatopsis acididurans]NKQ57703.1 proline racemase family protein [Amycolatopsis acididurans]